MFCFSTLNANTNPNPNCRPGRRPWSLTPWQSLPGCRPWPLTLWQSLPEHRPWLLTAINRVSGQGRCPGRLCHGVSGLGRRPGRLCHGVSGQGRCPGRQLELGLGFVLAFRVEKQNIGSSRNRNPVGAVRSIYMPMIHCCIELSIHQMIYLYSKRTLTLYHNGHINGR